MCIGLPRKNHCEDKQIQRSLSATKLERFLNKAYVTYNSSSVKILSQKNNNKQLNYYYE